MTILPTCQICNKPVSEMQVERDIPSPKLRAHYRCHGEHETQEITESLPNGPDWPTTAFTSSSCQGSRPDTSDSPSPIPQGPFGHWHELYSHPAQVSVMADSRPKVLYGSQSPPMRVPLSQFKTGKVSLPSEEPEGLAQFELAQAQAEASLFGNKDTRTDQMKVDADILADQLEIMTDRLAYVLNHCDVGLMWSKFEAELTEARTVLREYYSPNGRQELQDRISTVLKREPKPEPYNPLGPNTPTSRLILAMQEWFRKK